jgi:hypothetical protein
MNNPSPLRLTSEFSDVVVTIRTVAHLLALKREGASLQAPPNSR